MVHCSSITSTDSLSFGWMTMRTRSGPLLSRSRSNACISSSKILATSLLGNRRASPAPSTGKATDLKPLSSQEVRIPLMPTRRICRENKSRAQLITRIDQVSSTEKARTNRHRVRCRKSVSTVPPQLRLHSGHHPRAEGGERTPPSSLPALQAFWAGPP